ncbi:transposase [Leptospira sp. severe_002]|uniref:transposase n=1 Tax=Leptospira sp. severe_002 TaxID=2838237 RepID=UPI0035A3D03B
MFKRLGVWFVVSNATHRKRCAEFSNATHRKRCAEFSNATHRKRCAEFSVPRVDISGDTVRYGRIINRGCHSIRRVIVQAAWSLVRWFRELTFQETRFVTEES